MSLQASLDLSLMSLRSQLVDSSGSGDLGPPVWTSEIDERSYSPGLGPPTFCPKENRNSQSLRRRLSSMNRNRNETDLIEERETNNESPSWEVLSNSEISK
eukprot:g3687.t1